jgi:hypothetical protein
MESLLVSDILQFADCDFIIVDSSLTIVHSNNASSINNCVTEVFPYSLVNDAIQDYLKELSHPNKKSIIHSPDDQYPYVFTIHKVTYNNSDAVLIIAKLEKKFPEIIKNIYEELYDLPYPDDANHFVDVLITF